MRVALISFEYPPAVAVGGIGLYTWNAARLLQQTGHSVEVFAAGEQSAEDCASGIRVHRVDVIDRDAFRDAVVEPFRQRHGAEPYDVIESPEYGAEALQVHRECPELPRVVRLHTPHFLTHKLNTIRPTLAQELRFTLGALRRGRLARIKTDDSDLARRDGLERDNALQADAIAAPCRSIADIVSVRWRLPPESVCVVPNVFVPDARLLASPPPPKTKRIVFVGRLEVRKGILDLAAAIPPVLERHPSATFVFVGPPMAIPFQTENSIAYLQQRLGRYAGRCEFVGSQPKERIIAELQRADIGVFPSRWENFPNTCLEAMSAGRAVVGSSAGGMADMIEPGRSGVLVPPRAPRILANALNALLDAPDTVAQLGQAARQRVLDYCGIQAVAPKQIACYSLAIDRSRRRAAGFRQNSRIS